MHGKHGHFIHFWDSDTLFGLFFQPEVDRDVAVQSVTFMDDTIIKRDSKGADTPAQRLDQSMDIESVPPPPPADIDVTHEQE